MKISWQLSKLIINIEFDKLNEYYYAHLFIIINTVQCIHYTINRFLFILCVECNYCIINEWIICERSHNLSGKLSEKKIIILRVQCHNLIGKKL